MSSEFEDAGCLLEESIPWEVKLLEGYCNSKADLDSVSCNQVVVEGRLALNQ